MSVDTSGFREIHVWASEDSELDPLSRKFLQKYLNTLDKNDSILDIGCGQGKMVRFLKESGYPVLGIDLNEELVGIAQSAGLPVKHMDAVTAIKTEASNYTVFSMLDFVEHISLDVLAEILTAISEKPNVKVWIQTPNLDSIMGLKFWFHMPTHINALHPVVLRKLLHRFNFEIVSEWTDYGGIPWTGLRRKIVMKIVNGLFDAPLATMFEGGGNICLVAKTRAVPSAAEA